MSSSVHSLYQLANARLVLDRVIDDAEGELTPELEAELDAAVASFDDKVVRVGLYVRELLSNAEAVKAERDRLDAIIKRNEHGAERLKRYMHREMTRVGKRKVVGLLATVSIAKNSSPAVTFTRDLEALYHEHVGSGFVTEMTSVEYKPVRENILTAWKADPASLPAEIVVEVGEHVRIK